MIERAITTGNFDGCHMGHRELFDVLKAEAADRHLVPTVVAFEPHTRYLLGTPGEPALLTIPAEKKAFINSLGLKFAELPFTHEIAAMSFIEFVQCDILKELNAKYWAFGYDHRMGVHSEGCFESIRKVFPQIVTRKLPAVRLHGNVISSTLIRDALKAGEVTLANEYLGRPYRISGPVVMGKQLGRTLGFPTANIHPGRYKLIPKYGVYVGEVTLRKGETYRAVVNIGVQPSVGDLPMAIEAHLLGFDGNIYGMDADLDLFTFLRPEIHFASLNELKSQMALDTARAMAYKKLI